MSSETMDALVLHAVGDARFEPIPKPVAGEGEVLIRVGFCGVCGSDIPRTFVKGTYHFPTVCGHEFAGSIEACGQGVDDYKPGERVVVFPLLWCGKCPSCEKILPPGTSRGYRYRRHVRVDEARSTSRNAIAMSRSKPGIVSSNQQDFPQKITKKTGNPLI